MSTRSRVALVPGANRGLGLETSRQLLAKGLHVVFAGRDGRRARSCARRSRRVPQPGDDCAHGRYRHCQHQRRTRRHRSAVWPGRRPGEQRSSVAGRGRRRALHSSPRLSRHVRDECVRRHRSVPRICAGKTERRTTWLSHVSSPRPWVGEHVLCSAWPSSHGGLVSSVAGIINGCILAPFLNVPFRGSELPPYL